MTCSDNGVIRLLLLAAILTPSLTVAEDVFELRKQRLESMTDAQKSELLQKRRRFDRLSRAEQLRLKNFYEQLETNSNRDRLRRVLNRYGEWLKSLPPGQRAQLLELPDKERIARIKEIMKEQETQRFRMIASGKLKEEDIKAIGSWLDDFIRQNEQKILSALPKDRFADFIKDYDPEKHRRGLPFMAFRHASEKMPRPSAADFERLRQMMSGDAKDLLDKMEDEKARSEMLQRWIWVASFSRLRLPVSSEELDKYATTQLDPKQRERLENMPRDQMYRKLREYYYRDWFGQRAGNTGKRPFPGPPPRVNPGRGQRLGPDLMPYEKRGGRPGKGPGPPRRRRPNQDNSTDDKQPAPPTKTGIRPERP